MRKSLIYAFVMLLVISIVSAASVSRNMPSRISPGEDLKVSFDISGAETGKIFTLEDDLPDTFTFLSWEVTGSQEAKDKINHRAASGNRHGWSFIASQSGLHVEYTATAPSVVGSYDFDAVWFDSSGQSRDKKAVVVRTITCGDNTCEGTENSDTCEADCPKAPAPTAPVAPPEGEGKAPSAGGVNMMGIAIVVLTIIIGLAAYFLFFRKKR